MAFKDVDFQKAYAILELGRISERGKDTLTTFLKARMLDELDKIITDLSK